MRPVISIRRDMTDGLDIAAQLVRNCHPRRTKLFNQMIEEPPCSLCVSPCLNKNIQRIAIGIDGAPQPMFSTVDRDDHFIQMPFVVWLWPVSPNALGEMEAKTIDPQTNCLATNDNATLSQEIFNICST